MAYRHWLKAQETFDQALSKRDELKSSLRTSKRITKAHDFYPLEEEFTESGLTGRHEIDEIPMMQLSIDRSPTVSKWLPNEGNYR